MRSALRLPPIQVGFGSKFVAPLFVGTMLNPINSTMIATALVPIGRSFTAGAAETAWLVAALYLASAVAQPVMGKLADRLGPRWVYVFGLALVGVAGSGGALAPSLGLLVVVRVLIGIGTSAAYPAAMAMVRAQSQRLDQPTPGGVLGTLSIASLTSATIGPVLGGVPVGQLGWPSIFLANLPLALVGLWLTLRWLPADEPVGPHEHSVWREVDVAGIVAFGATLTVLLMFLMNLAHPDYWLLGGFVILAAALAGWELHAAQPFLDLRMLARNRRLLATYGRYGLTFLIIYGMLYGFPQWLQEVHGYSPEAAGLLLLPMSLIAGACTVLGAQGRRVRGPLLIGTMALLAASVALLGVSAGIAVSVLVGVGVLFGIPNGLNVVGNQAAMYAQAPAGDTGTAAGLFRTSQYIGAIFSSSLIGLVYGTRASDTGLHQLAWIFIVASVVLLVGTVLDRAQPTSSSPNASGAPFTPPNWTYSCAAARSPAS
jgi:MFS family permease